MFVYLGCNDADMAIKHMSFTCDLCTEELEEEDIRSAEEAAEVGWYIVAGPERILGGTGERCYCSLECCLQDLNLL